MSDRESLELTTDGRDIDPRLGGLSGMGSGQESAPAAPDRPMPGADRPVWDPSLIDVPAGAAATYYEQPIVKAPPWGPAIPAYIVLGGMSGSSALLAAAAQHRSALGGLTTAARILAAGSGAAGSVLLMSDLGRPERALNMFRVFRPTSPMSVGAYVLAVSVGASSAAVAGALLARRHRWIGAPAALAGLVAGLTGIPLAGYTGVLLGTTALPGWNQGLRTLPPLFMASAVATTGSALTLLPLGASASPAVDVYRVLGQLGELAAEVAHDRVLTPEPRLADAHEDQLAWRTGRVLTAASLVAAALPAVRRRRSGRILIGALGLAGGVATKVGIFQAGMASAADPRATTEQQRPLVPAT
jgi:hypothetical protein